MSLTTVFYIALTVWMLRMLWNYSRPGGHRGCGHRGSRGGSTKGGDRDAS
jgi:hypothetical protein